MQSEPVLKPSVLFSSSDAEKKLDLPASQPRSIRPRVEAVDLLRGIVMVIMMLDHTREFSHGAALDFDPTDLSKTNVMLFFTRWITHYCAPVFVFLAGTGAFFQAAKGKSKGELSKFLLTRGLWLVVVEMAIVRFIVWFNFDLHFVFMWQVIWAIGISMIVLAGLIYLPLRVIGIFSIAMIALHNLLDAIRVNSMPAPGSPPAPPGFWTSVWMVLHQPGVIFFKPNVYGLVLYPLIPWVGVMGAGYVFGSLYQLEAERRRKILFRLGLGLIAAFIVLRGINIYGDPNRWSLQKNFIFTVLSFLNVSKYPPSLLFLLMTLGPAIFALTGFDRIAPGPFSKAIITFGRVPLFFYIGQWIVAHGLAIIVGYLLGQPVGWQFADMLHRPSPNPGNLGFSLWVVYLFWIVGVCLLYPLCRWFAGVKQRRRDWWLSYL